MASAMFLDISMKLKDLYEMTFKTGTDLKYSNEMINQVIKNFNDNGKIVTNKIEGGKFSLIKFKSYYALKRNLDNNILSWLLMSSRTKIIINKKYWELLFVFTKEKFRKLKAASILLNAVKEKINYPILIDNAIFNDGVKFLSSLNRQELFYLKSLDKNTGEIKNFDIEKINKKYNAYIIENKSGTLYTKSYLPGVKDYLIYFILFSENEE